MPSSMIPHIKPECIGCPQLNKCLVADRTREYMVAQAKIEAREKAMQLVEEHGQGAGELYNLAVTEMIEAEAGLAEASQLDRMTSLQEHCPNGVKNVFYGLIKKCGSDIN